MDTEGNVDVNPSVSWVTEGRGFLTDMQYGAYGGNKEAPVFTSG